MERLNIQRREHTERSWEKKANRSDSHQRSEDAQRSAREETGENTPVGRVFSKAPATRKSTKTNLHEKTRTTKNTEKERFAADDADEGTRSDGNPLLPQLPKKRYPRIFFFFHFRGAALMPSVRYRNCERRFVNKSVDGVSFKAKQPKTGESRTVVTINK